MSSTQVVYTYNQTLFIGISNTGIDFGDLYVKSHAITYASAVYNDISSVVTSNGTTDYMFSYQSALNSADKKSLDTFVSTYVFVPMVDVCVHAYDTKPTGTDGGTFIANTWITRTLNKLDGAQIFATLANNQITLNAGTYIVVVKGISVGCGANRIRVTNVTDGTYSYGSNVISVGDPNTTSDIHAYFNFFVQTTIKIEHICATTVPGIGFGKATGFGLPEIYTRVFIHQTQPY